MKQLYEEDESELSKNPYSNKEASLFLNLSSNIVKNTKIFTSGRVLMQQILSKCIPSRNRHGYMDYVLNVRGEGSHSLLKLRKMEKSTCLSKK